MTEFTTCQKCNRLLRVKDGPICPDCKPKNAPKSDSKTDDKDADDTPADEEPVSND